MTALSVFLHAGHGDPIPGVLLGVTFGVAVAVGLLAAVADRDRAGHYVAAAVLSFGAAYAVVETATHTNTLAESSAVTALALGVPVAHVALAAGRRSARIDFLAVLYAGPVALVAYLLA